MLESGGSPRKARAERFCKLFKLAFTESRHFCILLTFRERLMISQAEAEHASCKVKGLEARRLWPRHQSLPCWRPAGCKLSSHETMRPRSHNTSMCSSSSFVLMVISAATDSTSNKPSRCRSSDSVNSRRGCLEFLGMICNRALPTSPSGEDLRQSFEFCQFQPRLVSPCALYRKVSSEASLFSLLRKGSTTSPKPRTAVPAANPGSA